MITVMKRALPGDLSRDIRRGRALRSGGRTDDRSGAGAGGLAPGWKETTAPDGRTYYFNDKGETSWEKPVAPSAATSSRAESKPKQGALVAAVRAAGSVGARAAVVTGVVRRTGRWRA